MYHNTLESQASVFGFVPETMLARDSSVGIATRYGLDGPGNRILVEGRDFPHLSRQILGPTQPPTQWIPGLSQG